MKRLIGRMAALTLAFAGVANAGDVWLDANVEGKLRKDLTLKIEQRVKFAEGECYDEETLGVLDYDVSSWFTVGAGYRWVEEKKKGDWKHESRPTAEVIFKHSISGWKLDDRIRVELRDREGTDKNSIRYRNRFRVRSPWKWTDLEISPYAHVETFIDDKDGVAKSDKFYRVRSQGGLTYKITDWLGGDLYYMAQTEKADGAWGTRHVLGIGLKATF